MSANPGHIDLNSDVVPFDLENEACGVSGSGTETLTVSPEGHGSSIDRVVEKVRNFSGTIDSLEGGCGPDIGGLDRNAAVDAKEEHGGIEVPESSAGGGVVVGKAKNDEARILESKCGVGNVGAVFGDSGSNERKRDEDETAKEGTEAIAATDGDASVTLAAEGSVGRGREDKPMLNGKEEEVAQVAGGDRLGQRIHAEEISGSGQLRDANVSVSIESHPESVSPLRASIPGVQVEVPDINCSLKNESSIVGANVSSSVTSGVLTSEASESQSTKNDAALETDKHHTAGGRVPETGSSENVRDDDNHFNLVVDLNNYTMRDENSPGEGNVKTAVSNPEFRASDLVWGKVRSHPWWPGQVFDPSSASDKAKKYFRKESYLIAYFGDQTFAWNEASKVKPFRAHFSQMEKQSATEEFRYAVDCALEEVSRRVEFGLACSCISEEVYAQLKTQFMVNAGVKEESSRKEGGDSASDADSLEPVELLDYVKALAQLPYGGTARLEFITYRAQLSAFYRWKGYYSPLPEFNTPGILLESDEDIQLTGENNNRGDLNVELVSSRKGKSRSQGSSSHKRKNAFGDGLKPSKKEKSLLDLLTDKGLSAPNGENLSGRGTVRRLRSQSPGRKRKRADAVSDDASAVKHRSPLSARDDGETIQTKRTFRVGDSIRRAANQMNGSSPLIKYSEGISHESEANNKSKQKLSLEFSSPHEMLSQLCLVARDPTEDYSFLSSTFSFFSEFRKFVGLDDPSLEAHDQSLEQVFVGKGGKRTTKTRRKSSKPGITETSKLELTNDSYWTDRVVQSIPEEQLSLENQNESKEILPESPSKKDMSTVEPQALEMSLQLDPKRHSSGENLESEAVDPLEESCRRDNSPTALILNFTDLNSVPSETNLIKIFSRFGPLNESETEVLKKSNRAKVVFRRHSDAEVAFSSAGKYSIFGPSLVSYRLKYLASTPSKASPGATKGDTTDTP